VEGKLSTIVPTGSAPPSASSANDKKPPTSETEQAKFNAAVSQALQARAAVEGRAPWTHGYETATIVKPDQNMATIAAAHGDPLGAEEADNLQFANPDRLFPGQVVFSPGRAPVNGRTVAQIQAAERADAAAACDPTVALKQAAQRQWARVQTDLEKELQSQGAGKLAPDQIVKPVIAALDDWAIGNDDLRDATGAAYAKVYRQWQHAGITSQQLAPIFRDRAAAAQDDQAFQKWLTQHPGEVNRAFIEEHEQESAQNWAKVQQDVEQWLETSVSLRAFPEINATKLVGELNAAFPHDTKFAAASQAALQSATQQWQALGITRDKLGPVINAYTSYEKALHADKGVGQARAQLLASIETELNAAARQAGSSPQGRLLAVWQRECVLQLVGPQTAAFRDAVTSADTDLEVTQPAERVAKAYQSGGAAAAARTLLTVTENGGPGYAGLIIRASLPTIDKISGDLGAIAQTFTGLDGLGAGNPTFNTIYGDLSAAVEQTDHGTAANALGSNTSGAANLVAAALAAHMPRSAVIDHEDPWGCYANAAQNTIGNAQGAALSLALAHAFNERGQSIYATAVVSGAANGYADLKTRTDNDVKAFAQVVGNLTQLRTSWKSFLTSSELNAATAGYAKHNPTFQPQFTQTFATVQQDGRAVIAAQQAFGTYKSELASTSGIDDLRAASGNLTGSDRSTLFAVAESSVPANNIARAISDRNGVQIGSPTSEVALLLSLSRSTRTLLSSLGKAQNLGIISLSSGAKLTLSGLGLVLSADGVYSELSHPGPIDAGGLAEVFYDGLGFVKYGREAAVALATRGALAKLQLNNDIINSIKAWKENATSKLFKGPYYLVAALADTLDAIQDARSGDYPNAIIDGVSGYGSLLLATQENVVGKSLAAYIVANSSIDLSEDAVAELFGPIGATITVLAQVAALGLDIYRQNEARDAFERDGQQFLEDALHLRPPIASALASVGGPNLGPAQALLDYAQQYHIPPGQLLTFLNTKNPVDVQNFVYLCENLSPQKGGTYAPTSPSDYHPLDYQPGGPFVARPSPREYVSLPSGPRNLYPPSPQSLRQLRYWAEAIFGANSVLNS
jgi:hypothetical protein